jgi:hypothetical protein
METSIVTPQSTCLATKTTAVLGAAHSAVKWQEVEYSSETQLRTSIKDLSKESGLDTKTAC